jgi:hypothetical protein
VTFESDVLIHLLHEYEYDASMRTCR